MSTIRIFAVAAVMLAVCVVLWLRAPADQEQQQNVGHSDAAPTKQNINVSPPPQPVSELPRSLPTPVVAPTPPSLGSASANPRQVGAYGGDPFSWFLAVQSDPETIARYRERLDTLPSWLDIPADVKDRLAPLALQDNFQINGVDEASERLFEEHQLQIAKQIEDVLGPDLYPLWKEYQDSGLARRNLASIADVSGELVEEHTSRTIAAAMLRAQRQGEEDRKARYGSADFRDYEPQVRLDARQQEEELMREAAKSHLTAAQLAAYDIARRKRLELDVERTARQIASAMPRDVIGK